MSLPSRLRPRLDFSDCFNTGDYPWSYEDKAGKDIGYSAYSMISRQNMKSPSSEESQKSQNQTVMSPISSNHISVPVSQSGLIAVDQSETNPLPADQSPSISANSGKLDHKIKQEIVEMKSNNNETST